MITNFPKVINYCFFNGDADGICAVLQFLQYGFTVEHFITGHKRDQNLLRYYNTDQRSGMVMLACDLELAKNLQNVRTALDHQCKIAWFDHHGSGEEKEFSTNHNFTGYIDRSSTVNTSSIVFNQLKRISFLKWSIVGLFGDNINAAALNYCNRLSLSNSDVLLLQTLGQLVNYNSYGENINDLIINPISILDQAKHFTDPIEFFYGTSITQILQDTYTDDLDRAIRSDNHESSIVFLPNLSWAKRIYGTLANKLNANNPTKSIAVLVDIGEENYLVSVRASVNQPISVGDLCRRFDSGGGRVKAGGINILPKTDLEKFLKLFKDYQLLD